MGDSWINRTYRGEEHVRKLLLMLVLIESHAGTSGLVEKWKKERMEEDTGYWNCAETRIDRRGCRHPAGRAASLRAESFHDFETAPPLLLSCRKLLRKRPTDLLHGVAYVVPRTTMLCCIRQWAPYPPGQDGRRHARYVFLRSTQGGPLGRGTYSEAPET